MTHCDRWIGGEGHAKVGSARTEKVLHVIESELKRLERLPAITAANVDDRDVVHVRAGGEVTVAAEGVADVRVLQQGLPQRRGAEVGLGEVPLRGARRRQ